MASHSTLPPDTLITAKVTIGNQTRRFKLALRDLGANVLPHKLRELLVIPDDQTVVFERYSDSAGSYVILDPKNPAVYKQLYRAAKAKLKLRFKATIIYQGAEESVVSGGSSFVTTEIRPSPPAYRSTTSLVSPPAVATPEPATPASVEVSPAQLDRAVADAVSSFLNGEEYLAKLRETVREEVEKHEKEAPVPAPFSAPEPAPSVVSPPSVVSEVLDIKSPAFTYAIFCDSCEGNIYDVHYHCGICDKGDYDLCQACVGRGTHCKDSSHWLIKRTLTGGTIVSSVTESIKAKVPEPAVEEKEEEEHELTRTCNCCIVVLPEKEFVSCVQCSDYDLCISCHVAGKHGHHPRHEFVPATPETKLSAFQTSLLSPGRNFCHFARCDGCDGKIYGVRHKCMSCPDWDYCSKCIVTAPLNHHGHRFVPIYDPLPTMDVNTRRNTAKHYGVYCDGPLCADKHRRSWIDGDRYKCAVCPDTDFCASCEASPINTHNATHPLIKLKSPIRNVHVTTLEPDSQNSRVMGDGHYNPPASTSNAATQVQTVVDVKPTEEYVPAPESSVGEPEHIEHVEEEKEKPEEPLQANFISEVIQDGAIMVAGSNFSQTWQLVNSGPTCWPAGVQPQFTAGDYMFEPESINATKIEHDVAFGETVSFTVNLKAPLHANRRHISYWRLTAPDGTRFGSKLWCDIQVVEAPKIEEPKVEEPKQMIFPRLPVESPVASVEDLSSASSAKIEVDAVSVPAVSVTSGDTRSLPEDSDDGLDINSIADDLDSFLTDDEYDVLDASDEEAFQECERVL
ncbi:uncharacterized protein LAJ45_07999 [Morchella importuna]|uniref:uncharacterized protein n=1 Tax=Morchella importuna TaxID=1174673 RepID=UPI001E8E3B8E|nr:uncharacterized protein LAJ45_07999 [Morchella importuna]KAH8147898.1 hypothetical protein LAJ45_07999 [Morchella importuna]